MRKGLYSQSGPLDSVLRTYKLWAQIWARFTLAGTREIASCTRVVAKYSLKTKIVCGLAAAAAYFAAALWLKVSYVEPWPKGAIVVQLLPPFERHGNAVIIRGPGVAKLQALADREDDENDTRSPVVIFENGTPLGPAHSNYGDIQNVGMGRFAHWGSQGVVFSTSDNSNPATNGRYYWAVVPLSGEQLANTAAK